MKKPESADLDPENPEEVKEKPPVRIKRKYIRRKI